MGVTIMADALLEELKKDLAEALDLISDGADTFRYYERNHRAKVTGAIPEGMSEDAWDKANEDATAKAERNRDFAKKFEAFLTKQSGEELSPSLSDELRAQAEMRANAKNILREQLPNLDVAANPTKCEVYTASGRTARTIHDAITLLTS
jgi:hypothetical protein